MAHQCQALVVTCIDFRFQKAISEWLFLKGLNGKHDRVSLAGAQKAFLGESAKIALNQVDISVRLHGITEVHLLAHMDCGAYGGSTKFASSEAEKEKYLSDLREVKQLLQERFNLKVFTYVIKFNAIKMAQVEEVTV